MSDLHRLKTDNENSLQELNWAIATSQGEFSLILALCNATSLQRRLLQRLQASSEIEMREIVLDKSVKALYQSIHNTLDAEYPQALIVSALESVSNLEQLLTTANQVREEFRKNFHFPLMVWVTDEVLQKLMRLAPDLHSWSTTVEFAIATDDLINFIRQTADDVFAKVAAAGAGRYLDSTALNLQIGSPHRVELESAWVELHNRGVVLNPELEANLEFVLGRAFSGSMEQSRQHYERSLELFGHHSSSPQSLERQGCVLYSLGLWWGTYAVLHHTEQNRAHGIAKNYFQQCIQVFEQANRQDLVAKFINALGLILQQLQQWNELQTVANKALALHETYPHQLRLARAYGFLAEVAIAKSAWTEAKQTSETALSLLDSVQINPSNSDFTSMQADLDWERSYHGGWYLFALARSQSALNQPQAALQTLETARLETKVQYDPELYIQILAALREGYFQKGEYLTAFHIKQEQRSIEQQYGFRAFIGAGRLQAQQVVNNPALPFVEQQATVASEIAASGRQQDINRLIERMGRPDHKLTIIYGQSGVGKSSIIQAGLIPVLKQKPIGTRDVLPIFQQVYTDWIKEFANRLQDSLSHLTLLTPFTYEDRRELDPFSLQERLIIEQLHKHDDDNLLTVLIFDQFEEFFFVYKDPKQRRIFYDFLNECLDIPFVKVILCLREDYLHYLLECNNRLADFDVISNNILDKSILYYLGNFSSEETKSVIQNLTIKTQLFLEPLLIDNLVMDLARDLGEVRPIELQVVGAQLQTEKITKLEQYQQLGPKEKLVERFLDEIVKDCGAENERAAQLILYLLTDENNTRPLKTRAELAKDLAIEANKLDSVLEILTGSGLVFRIPESSNDRYQLVHDYLVPFIRQQRGAEILAELEKEKEQRKLAEAKLNQVLKRRLREAYIAGVALTSLAVLAVVFGLGAEHERRQAEIAQILALSTSSTALLASDQKLDALIEALRAGRQLKRASWEESNVKITAFAALQQGVEDVTERNRLEDHGDSIWSVAFSSDNQLLASCSTDKTVKIWRSDGTLLQTLVGHNNAVTSLSFSPDSQTLASASLDKTVKFWRRNAITGLFESQPYKTLKAHRDSIYSVSFSPDGEFLATASKDATIKIWRKDGSLLKTLRGHRGRVHWISFSPDSQFIASASEDKTVKIWRRDGSLVTTLRGHQRGVLAVTFSPNGKFLASGSRDKTVKLWRREHISSKGSFDFRPYKTLLEHRNQMWGLSFSPDSEKLASGSEDNTINLWSVNGTLLKTFKGHSDRVTTVAFSPDNKLLASGSYDKSIKLWSLDAPRRPILQGHKDRVLSVTWSPDGQMLASGSRDRTVKLWQRNPSSGEMKVQLYKTLIGHKDQVSSVSFDPKGKILASASFDKTVKLWRRDGTFLKTLQGHSDSVTSVNFSPDGQLLASASKDKTVKLWSRDGRLLRTLVGHWDRVNSVKFSPDSQIIASASDDKTVKLWRMNGTLLKTLQGHKSWVLGVNFSPDGQTLATASWDNTVKLWNYNGTLLKTLKGHIDSVNSVNFSQMVRCWLLLVGIEL